MPNVGDIIIRTHDTYTKRSVWTICPECHTGRWTDIVCGKPRRMICKACTNRLTAKGRVGELSNQWKGGRQQTADGYISVKLSPDNPYYPMTSCDYLLEHRLIMATYLGRCLSNDEIVHHVNGNKQDNGIENLRLMGRIDHMKLHMALRGI